MIRNVQFSDVNSILDIYNPYVIHSTFTFEEKPVDEEEMKTRISNVIADGLPWIVYEEEGRVVGYAYAGKWKTRSAYRFSVETSIYLSDNICSKGVGTKLYTSLLEELSSRNIHTVIGGVALPNNRSQALHEKFGFKKIAHFSQVGYKHSQWLDVGYWELYL